MGYRAFFSYARADDRVANWLHRQLDSYRTPNGLVGIDGALGPVPAKLHPIFRDRTDLEAGGLIDQSLQQALEASACLVVLCTPTSANSKWVNHECETFIRLGREDRIFPVIALGEPDSTEPAKECFPPALRGRGILAADLREIRLPGGQVVGDGREGGRLKLLAGLLGVSLDTLVQRERRRQRFTLAALTTAALIFAGMSVAAIGFAVIAQTRATENAALAVAEREAREEGERRAAAEQAARQAESEQRNRAEGLSSLNDEQIEQTNRTVHLLTTQLLTQASSTPVVGITLFDGYANRSGLECPEVLDRCLDLPSINIARIAWRDLDATRFRGVCSQFEGTSEDPVEVLCSGRRLPRIDRGEEQELGFSIDEAHGIAVSQARSLAFCGGDGQCYFPTVVWLRGEDGRYRPLEFPAGTRDEFDQVAVIDFGQRLDLIVSAQRISGPYESFRHVARYRIDIATMRLERVTKFVIHSEAPDGLYAYRLLSVIQCSAPLTDDELRQMCERAL